MQLGRWLRSWNISFSTQFYPASARPACLQAQAPSSKSQRQDGHHEHHIKRYLRQADIITKRHDGQEIAGVPRSPVEMMRVASRSLHRNRNQNVLTMGG